MAFLDSSEQTIYPIAYVHNLLINKGAPTCKQFAKDLGYVDGSPRMALQKNKGLLEQSDQFEQTEPGTPAFCPNCGFGLFNNSKSCKQCGARFSSEGGWKPLVERPKITKKEPVDIDSIPLSKWIRYMLRGGHACVAGLFVSLLLGATYSALTGSHSPNLLTDLGGVSLILMPLFYGIALILTCIEKWRIWRSG